MLTFLNSIILAGLAAIVLPLLIHLLTRQRLKRIQFSSVNFLKLLQAQKMRQVRLREILLLILRTLIVLFLILAFARPALKGSFATGVKAHAKTTTVILLDNSFSMGRETPRGSVFQLAKDRAAELANLFQEGDEAFLILFSDAPTLSTPEATHNFPRLKRQIQEAPLSNGTTNVRQALLAAYDLVAGSTNLNKEIYLLTDMQRIGWQALEKDSLVVGAGARLYILAAAPEDRWSNLTVDAVDYSDQLPEANKPLRLAATVANRSPGQQEQALVELYVDNVRRDQRNMQLAPEETQGVSFTTVVAEPGIHTGYAEVADHQLSADNRRFFALNVPRQIQVLIVGDDPRAAFFLQTALRPDEQVHGVMIPEAIPTEQLSHRQLDGLDVVIFADLPQLGGDELAKVDRFVRQGGGVLILLGQDVNQHFYNDYLLKRLCPLVIQETLGSPGQWDSYLTIERVTYEHPIFQIFRRTEGEKFPSPRFYLAYDIDAGDDVTVLASFNNGSPALVESRIGRGRVLFMPTAIDPAWSDMPIRGAFIPLVHRSVQYLATAQPSGMEELLVGSPLTWELAEIPAGQEVVCTTPDGERIMLRPSSQRDYATIAFEPVKDPGIYQFFLGEQLLTAFAVNVDLKESDLEPIAAGTARDLLGEEGIFIISSSEDLETAVLQSRYGRELWKAVLWGVLALMVVEMALGKSGGREGKEEKR